MKNAAVFLLCCWLALGHARKTTESKNRRADCKLCEIFVEAGTCLSKKYELGTMNPGRIIKVPHECTTALCNDDGTITYTGCKASLDNCVIKKRYVNLPHPDCCKHHYYKCTKH